MRKEQARDLILAEAAEEEYPHGFPPNTDCQLDYDCSECQCPKCIHPVDRDIIAQLRYEDDQADMDDYEAFQDAYLAGLTDHERTMYEIANSIPREYVFTLKASGKLKLVHEKLVRPTFDVDDIPF